MIKYVNHKWQINKYEYREIENPIGEKNGFFHLIKNGVEYKIQDSCIACLVPLNKFYIRIGLVNKLLKRVG